MCGSSLRWAQSLCISLSSFQKWPLKWQWRDNSNNNSNNKENDKMLGFPFMPLPFTVAFWFLNWNWRKIGKALVGMSPWRRQGRPENSLASTALSCQPSGKTCKAGVMPFYRCKNWGSERGKLYLGDPVCRWQSQEWTRVSAAPCPGCFCQRCRADREKG